MKTPSEYIEESRFAFCERWGKAEDEVKADFEYGNGLNKLMSQEEMDRGIAIEALQSMQEDHEREMIEFHLFICKLYNKPDDSLCIYLNTASEEAITQFRKG